MKDRVCMSYFDTSHCNKESCNGCGKRLPLSAMCMTAIWAEAVDEFANKMRIMQGTRVINLDHIDYISAELKSVKMKEVEEINTVLREKEIDMFVEEVINQLIAFDKENDFISLGTSIDIVSDVGKKMKDGLRFSREGIVANSKENMISELEALIDEIRDGKCSKEGECSAWNCTDCYKERMRAIVCGEKEE